MTTEASEAALRDLEQRWLRAELDADADTLDLLTDEHFTLVGPLGFILGKSGWLDRYRSGALQTSALDWDEVSMRLFADTAILVGRIRQRACYLGRPSDGQFRATHIAVRRDDEWLLVGMHLSPIATPPAATAAATSNKETA